MTLRHFLIALAASWTLLAADTTVVVLRHAEKGARSLHAQLSTTGHRRAAALAGSLAALRPAAVFASDYLRTQQTVGPLAHLLGLDLQIRARGAESDLGREILRRFPGQTWWSAGTPTASPSWCRPWGMTAFSRRCGTMTAFGFCGFRSSPGP